VREGFENLSQESAPTPSLDEMSDPMNGALKAIQSHLRGREELLASASDQPNFLTNVLLLNRLLTEIDADCHRLFDTDSHGQRGEIL